ncbi:hypothetical protein ERJ75_001230600 [Trypanosoma vivax]|uniref:Uncharacterized protein n=1 Tax=Trypanosoma vivax (strain Y486) TaxID=1055687 RepID=G0U1E3_TRYVY|nr:hypothetical protein TRVL_02077 [Trypanosoma vivax]KAH8608808.1 hypothetical protein ERJ75_001230600 [Trypanosoma vivax]CCC49898.1 conserved hypothetical protein [Trypanosoma vivax Y486]
MPHVTTPFSVSVRSGEQLSLCSEGDRLPDFVAKLSTVTFTRRTPQAVTRSPSSVSTAATVTLNACVEDETGCGTCGFAIARHHFIPATANDRPSKAADTHFKGELEEVGRKETGVTTAAAVRLRSPIVITSRCPVRFLEVKLSFERGVDDGAEYAVTLHGTQKTFLTRRQMKLLRSA